MQLKYAIALTALATLQQPAASQVGEAPSVTLVPISSREFADCPANMDWRTIVRISIDSVLDISDNERHVRYKTYRDNKSDVTKDEEEYDANDSLDNVGPNDPRNEFNNNPFHIYMPSIVSAPVDTGKTEYVMVRVILHGRKLEFREIVKPDPDFPADATKTVTVRGVTFEEKKYGDWFCQKVKIASGPLSPINTPRRGRRSVLTFFVKKGKTAEKGAASINFVIGSRGPNGRETPILIDPKIQNEG